MRISRCLLIAPLLALSALAAAGTPPDFSALTPLVERAQRGSGHPGGIAIAVVLDGRIVHEGYAGLADIGSAVPVDRDTVFYIASATKPFTALEALLLDARGALDTDTRLQAMFPDAAFQGLDAGAVTVRDLLTHTGGVRNASLVWASAYSGLHDAARRRALAAATQPDPDAPHGRFRYGNVGYNLVSVWLDAQQQRPWQQRLADALFKPLGMARTTASVRAARAAGWSIARPYSLLSAQPRVPLDLEKDDATMHAAGGLLSTAPDLARFLLAQLDDGRLDGRAVLPAEVIARAQQPQVPTDGQGYEDFPRSHYAWGWYVGEYKGQRLLHHFGGFAGFHAHLSFMPDMDAGLVILHNEDTLAPKLSALIADAVYGTILGEPDVTARVERRLDGLLDRVAGLEAMVQTQRQQIEGRAWSLSLPMTAYAGSYAHPLLGAIHLSVEDGRPLLRWGRLAARATGYDGTDQARIEWVPNSGQVITFTVSDGRVQALSFDGMRFDRTEGHAAGTPPR